MHQPGFIWLIALAVFVVIEAVTYQLVSVWFAIGAAGALIAFVCGAALPVQIGVFVALSVVMFAALRPVSMKLVNKHRIKTNADELEGKAVLITEAVDNVNGTGAGKINGMAWTVRSVSDESIPVGSTARIVRIEGVKLIVDGGK